MTPEEIRNCFDYAYYTKNVDAIFNRVFVKPQEERKKFLGIF